MHDLFMVVLKKAATAVTRCNKAMQHNRHARRFSIASLPRPSRSSSSAPTYSRSEELSRPLSTQLSSNEREQPVCRSGALLVVRNASRLLADIVAKVENRATRKI